MPTSWVPDGVWVISIAEVLETSTPSCWPRRLTSSVNMVDMFEQALKVICQLPASDRDTLIARLDRVRTMSHNLGYGVGDDMDSLLVDYTGN